MSGGMIFFLGVVVGIVLDSIIQVAMIRRKDKMQSAKNETRKDEKSEADDV